MKLSNYIDDKDSYDSGGWDWCIHCETCREDEDTPHEYFEGSSDDKCLVCQNRHCKFSFSTIDVEVDHQGEWHCAECNSSNIMIHERCQCDVPTASGCMDVFTALKILD